MTVFYLGFNNRSKEQHLFQTESVWNMYPPLIQPLTPSSDIWLSALSPFFHRKPRTRVIQILTVILVYWLTDRVKPRTQSFKKNER